MNGVHVAEVEVELFADDMIHVWRESYRKLSRGGEHPGQAGLLAESVQDPASESKAESD